MVSLQKPAHFVPHVVQGGVSHIGGSDYFVIVQPGIVLRSYDCQPTPCKAEAMAQRWWSVEMTWNAGH